MGSALSRAAGSGACMLPSLPAQACIASWQWPALGFQKWHDVFVNRNGEYFRCVSENGMRRSKGTAAPGVGSDGLDCRRRRRKRRWQHTATERRRAVARYWFTIPGPRASSTETASRLAMAGDGSSARLQSAGAFAQRVLIDQSQMAAVTRISIVYTHHQRHALRGQVGGCHDCVDPHEGRSGSNHIRM